MLIKPSQRQKDKPQNVASPLTLHRQLASGRARRSRLFVCSSAALAASFVAWLVGLPTALHLALVGVGFLAGFAWRLERAEPWALRWIDERAGLAYRTALERTQAEPANTQAEDSYGFFEALGVQVERTAGRLEPPTAQPWWLPLLAVALSLAVLPAIGLPGIGGGFGGGNAPLGPNESAPPAAQSDADSQPDSAPDTSPEAAEVENAEEDAQPELERTFDAPGEDSSGEGGEASAGGDADSETLERYLESLEAQENDAPPSGAERNPFARGEAQGEQSAEQNTEPSQSQPDAPSEAQPNQGAREAQGEQEGQEQESQQGQGEQGDEATQDGGGEGASGADAPEQTQAPREGEQEAGGSEGTPSEQEQEAEGEQPQSAQGESESQQEGQQQEEGQGRGGQGEGDPNQGESAEGGSGGPQEGEEEGGGAEGEEGDGAGSLPSASTPSSAERLEGTPQTNPELLEGQRGAGATNAAGETLAPGSDVVDIPNAQTNAEYERAAEEAINEGRIPVEYQDILRDYFR